MDRNEISEADYEEAALLDATAADELAAQRRREGRDPETGAPLTDVTGVLSHDRKDALKAAAIAAGADPDDYLALSEMSIEQLQERIAELEAIRMAKQVKG